MKYKDYEEMKFGAVATMNYLFLRASAGKYDTLFNHPDENVSDLMISLTDELSMFLTNFANMDKIPCELYDLVLQELKEGSYLDNLSKDELCDGIAKTIFHCLGEVNENLYNHYTYLVGHALEERII